MGNKKSIRELSKKNWGTNWPQDESGVFDSKLMLGAILRIADSLEIIANELNKNNSMEKPKANGNKGRKTK
jgi:hypothetical protein